MKIMNPYLFEIKKATKKIVLFFAIFCTSLVSAQIVYPFSTCGATGNIGPTAPQITAGYFGTTLAGSVTVVGGVQTFIVPISGPYRIDAMGGGGGGVAPGCGARMVGEFNLTAGTVLKIIVGQKGILENGYTRNLGASGGGGGGSFVVLGGVTPLVIAGGGGGSGCDNAGTPGIIASSAGTTGPLNNGGTFGEGNPGAGFSGNAALGLHGGTTIAFSFLNGGVGGVGDGGGGTGYGGFGGGGGDGYADGGGGGGVSGGNTRPDGSGGQGGGSLNTGTSQVNTAGFNCGQGSVILTLLYSVSMSQTSTISCNSYSTAVLSATVNGGLAPYTYTWMPIGGNASIASGLSAGTYTCFVKDALGNPTSNTYTVTQPASFSITASVSNSVICNGASTVFNGAGASTYTWTGGVTNGVPYSPTVTNTYSVTGSNALGCRASNTVVLTVTVNPGPAITVSSGTICAGKSFTIIPAGASTYTFQGGSSVVSPIVNSTYTVVGTSTAGCISPVVTSSVTINANPIITVNSGSICSGNSFTIAPAGASTYTVQGGSFIVSPIVNSTYTVAGTSLAGCVSPIVTSTITISANPTITVNSGSICSGNSFTIIPAGANTYTLQGGSSIVSPIVNSTYTVTGTSIGGCVSSGFASSTVTVLSNPTITVNSGVICPGNSFTIVPAGASTYTIQGGSSVVNPIVNSTYTVAGTSIAGCVSSFATSSVTINANSIITVNSGSICSGNSFTIVPAGASTYTIQGGSFIVNPTVNTTYTVAGTSLAGCVSSIVTSTITISATPTISVNSGSICAGDSFTIVPAGASTYSVQGGSAVVSPIVNTTYTVIGTSAAGCLSSIITSSLLINANSPITVNSGSICSGNSFTMVPGGAISYTFQGGSSIVTPTATSSYSITGTNALGCISNTLSLITVNATPTVIITPSLSTICLGANKTLVASGASTYNWVSSSSLNTLIGASVIATPTVSTTYTVTGSIGTCSNSSTAIVNVVTPAVITVSASPASICSSQSSILTASGGVTYLWSPGLGLSTVSGSSTNTTPNVTTTYTVLATDALGCVSSASVTVTVTPTPTLTLSASSSTICEGATTNLQASGASNYLWSPSGSLSSSTLPSVIATPAVTTMYIVIGNNGVCTDSKNIQITVIPKIIPAITPNDTAICFGKTIQLSASGGSEYLWSPASTLSSPTSANVIAKPLATTIYTVTVTLNNNCPQTKSVKITVNPLPYVYAGADTTINIDESYILHGTGNVEVGFVPLDGNPLNCNYCSSVEVNPKVNTCYVLKGITNFGCENSDDVCITVTKDYNIYIPNAFTPNGDTDNDVFMPVGYGLESYEMSIFDRWGNTIFKSSAERKGWDGSVKGKIAEAGVYVYRIVFKTMGNLEVVKVGHLTVLSKVK